MKPDYAKWKRKELWTIFEAACLAATTEPTYGKNVVDALSKISEFNKRQVTGEIYGHAKDAIDVRKLKQAARSRTSMIMDKRVTPAAFAAWLSRRGDYPIPPELKNLASHREQQDVNRRERMTYNNIIGALVEIILGKHPQITLNPHFKSEAALINWLSEKYEGFAGLSQRSLQAKFADAKRGLGSK